MKYILLVFLSMVYGFNTDVDSRPLKTFDKVFMVMDFCTEITSGHIFCYKKGWEGQMECYSTECEKTENADAVAFYRTEENPEAFGAIHYGISSIKSDGINHYNGFSPNRYLKKVEGK